MLGAIYTALSGLNAHSKALQTISNNVSNINTLGYKGTTVTFEDAFSGGSDGSGFSLGSNSDESGTGVKLASDRVDFHEGDLRQTGNPLDLAIQGSGFLALLSGNDVLYARTGQFKVDDKGFIVDQVTGDKLAMLGSGNQLSAIDISSKRTDPPVASTIVKFSGHLSPTATSDTMLTASVFDSIGNKHDWTIKFSIDSKDPTKNTWNVTVTDESGAEIGSGTLKFIPGTGTVDPTTATLTVSATPVGAAPLSVKLDFSSGVDNFSFGSISNLTVASVDGNAPGSLSTVTVDQDGNVKLTYSNGKDAVVGPVAIAAFRDPQQLQRTNNGLFTATDTTQRRLVHSGADGAGTLLSGQVEASNVNLSDEFGELILVQRGFQASSQVISVANDMIQQLFAIKGQG